MLTQTAPGELLILRNAGNIIPSYQPNRTGGEQATIEFAIEGLGVKDIIVCGHSHCGAIKGLLNERQLEKMPSLKSWLREAELARQILKERYPEMTDTDNLNVAIQENVLVQIVNLRSHPVVASALEEGRVKLHGWVYKFETGQVFEYDPESGQFQCLTTSETGPNRDPIDMSILDRYTV
jgi:carbonic anhydrase